MTIKCAWCGAWMGEKCPECGAKATEYNLPAMAKESNLEEYRCERGHYWSRSGIVNHGICEDCYDKHSPAKGPGI